MLHHLNPFARALDIARAKLATPHRVEGIDISHHQGDIDWQAVNDSGVAFAYIRSTLGVDLIDRKLDRNVFESQGGSGIVTGFYHFGSWYNADERNPELDALNEADFFVETVNGTDPDAWESGRLPPVIDVELSGKARKAKGDRWKKKPGDHMSYAAVEAWVATFLQRVDELTGRRCAIYTGRYFWIGDTRKAVQGRGLGRSLEFADRLLWLAQYNRGLGPKKPIGEWSETIWQRTGSGSCPGIKGRVDRNVFMKSRADFLRMLDYPSELPWWLDKLFAGRDPFGPRDVI